MVIGLRLERVRQKEQFGFTEQLARHVERRW
jgi:hypothetical protein